MFIVACDNVDYDDGDVDTMPMAGVVECSGIDDNCNLADGDGDVRRWLWASEYTTLAPDSD